MIVGVLWGTTAAAHYRAIDPMRMMERLGHGVVWPPDADGGFSPRQLEVCDVVHVYRRTEKEVLATLQRLAARGTGITWDNDDDLSKLPKEAPRYKEAGGITGHQIHAATVRAGRQADVMTTTTEALAERYRSAGIERIEVIENQLGPELRRRRRRHDGVVIGWVAGLEHKADAKRLKIAAALREVLARHPDARVECIGVDLGLQERYRHDEGVEFRQLSERIGAFDIAIAPLADIPFNHTRSDIKVKEYSAGAVPWLASPVGPYLGLGEDQGGRLVPDDGWVDAIDQLLSNARERKRLSKRAKSWAKRQRVETEAKRWEAVFLQAAAIGSSRSVVQVAS
jgi:glycosyltransferase involved in cell wall biosynthesis